MTKRALVWQVAVVGVLGSGVGAWGGSVSREVREAVVEGSAERGRVVLEEARGRLGASGVRGLLDEAEGLVGLGLEEELLGVLGEVEGSALRALVREARRGGTREGQAVAVEALGRRDEAVGVRGLLECAERVDDEDMAVWAVRWLGAADESARWAVPGLIGLLGDGVVVEEVLEALRGLTGEEWETWEAWRRWWEEEGAGVFVAVSTRAAAGASGGGAWAYAEARVVVGVRGGCDRERVPERPEGLGRTRTRPRGTVTRGGR